MTKSVTYNIFNIIPDLPGEISTGGWFYRERKQPQVLTILQREFSVYAVYTDPTDPAMQYYKNYLTDKYYSEICRQTLSNISLIEDIYYQKVVMHALFHIEQ